MASLPHLAGKWANSRPRPVAELAGLASLLTEGSDPLPGRREELSNFSQVPAWRGPVLANFRLDRRMAAVKGRRPRRGVAHAVQLNARVLPDRREKVVRAAEALGISVNAYMDALIAREQVDANGRPVWWTDPAPADQEELPLKSA